MLKAQYNTRGPNPIEVIDAVETDTPAPGAGQVLVELLASPINPSDVFTLTGDYGILPPLPAVGGNEGVGKVIQHGEGVSEPGIGQTVLLPVGIGTWQTHFVLDADKLVPLPNEADPLQLAMIAINPPTASLMLSEYANLQAGDWVIQNAANSAVGNYLIQIAKSRGINTVNIVRRESAIAELESLGGDVVLVDGDDVGKRVKEATGGASIQLAIDAVGGKATNHLLDCIAHKGTLVTYGAMSGDYAKLSPGNMIFKEVTVKGFWLAKWIEHTDPQTRMAMYGELVKLIATGQLKAPVQATYSVKDIKQAMTDAVQSERTGKVLVTA